MKRIIAGLVTAAAGMLVVTFTSTGAVGDGDATPRACVDCHKGDKKLSTHLASWAVKVEGAILEQATAAAPPGVKIKAKHPKIPAGKAIPKNCLGCHAKTSKMAPPFARLMHLVHETGANHQDCTSCHKLDAKTGTWTIPSADED